MSANLMTGTETNEVLRLRALSQNREADMRIRAIYEGRATWSARQEVHQQKLKSAYALVRVEASTYAAWIRLLNHIGYDSSPLHRPALPDLDHKPETPPLMPSCFSHYTINTGYATPKSGSPNPRTWRIRFESWRNTCSHSILCPYLWKGHGLRVSLRRGATSTVGHPHWARAKYSSHKPPSAPHRESRTSFSFGSP